MHLIVAEKALVAERIAEFLSGPGKKVQTVRDGNTVHHIVGDTVVMGLKGHVVELDFTEGYTNWRSAEFTPKSLINAEIVKRVSEGKIVSLLKKSAKTADKITIATDYDREGELIGKEAVELIRPVNKTVTIKRARFSAITKEEVLSAIENAQDLDVNLAESGESRQVIDLVWGASLTRFLTIAAHRAVGDVLSAGRVQSPTLAMIVDKEREIEAFVPEKYWMLTVAASAAGHQIEARHAHGKFTDKAEAEKAFAATSAPLKVTEVITGTKTDKAPTPLDTTALIVGAGRLGISASSAMTRAEELYMRGFISYPRTDNTTYPKSLNTSEQLTMLSAGVFAADVKYVRENMRAAPTRGKKQTTDHPPIYPTGAATPEDIPDVVTWKLYEFVVRRFFATLCNDAEWETMKVNMSAATEPYTITGGRLVKAGWRNIYPYSKAEENVLPKMTAGDSLDFLDRKMEEKETLPPARYSQSRLIQQMEENGLGTKSTRHDVIGKLISRKYVEGNPLKPTVVGRAVTETLEKYAPTIALPDMTKTLEEHMADITTGSKTLESVLSESRGMLTATFEKLEANEEAIGEEIMLKTRETQNIGTCPVCGKVLSIKRVRGRQFIGCSGYPECTFNISLPPVNWGNAVKIDDICEVHNVHHVQLLRKGNPPWKLGCPVCSHIETGKGVLKMMPGITDADVAKLNAAHIYTAYDFQNIPSEKVAERLQISPEAAAKLKADAEDVIEALRMAAELKRFVAPLIPFKRRRSAGSVVNAMRNDGIRDIYALVKVKPADMIKYGVTEEEAKTVIEAAVAEVNSRRMKETGVAAVSLKKYIAAGYDTPEKLAAETADKISAKTGVSIPTVMRHLKLVSAYLNQQ